MNIKFALVQDTLVYLGYVKSCTDKELKELSENLLNSYATLIEENLQGDDTNQLQVWEELKKIIDKI